MESYKRGSHTAWDLKYHLVWTTKYRYQVLGGDVGHRLRELLREIARSQEMQIHDQRNRITEQCYTKSDSTTKGLSNREICLEGGVSGHHGCVEEVGHANSQLETSSESVYYFVW